jgi:hypothetical protein
VTRVLIFGCFFAAIVVPSRLPADTIFWLQTTDIPQAPDFVKITQAPGSTGKLFLFGSSDTARVGSISFKFTSSNTAALSFTSPASYGPQNLAIWNLPGAPITVTPSLISGINAAAVPPSDSGFGPGSSVGNTVLLASWGYRVGPAVQVRSDISLVVGDGEVTDYSANYLTFHVGSPLSPTISGSLGNSAIVGSVSLFFPEPTSLTLLGIALLGAVGTCRRRPTSLNRV